jgi:hypothetical protein
MRLRLVGLVLAGAFLAGCGGQSPAVPRAETPLPPGASAVGPSASVRADPVALVGLWKLAVDGEPEDTVLRVSGEGDLAVFGRCTSLTGSWQANTEGQFLGNLNGFSVNARIRECPLAGKQPTDADFMPAWLGRVAGFRVDGKERLLLDQSDATVARLMPGAVPTPRSDLLPEMTGVPVVTDEIREQLRAVAVPLPSPLKPATTGTLLGRWQPAGKDVGAYVEFKANGQWTGSDGCNGEGGRWTAGAAGSFLALAGPTTLIGCANVPVGAWLSEASRAGLDGAELVLVDGGGKELGRLSRR